MAKFKVKLKKDGTASISFENPGGERVGESELPPERRTGHHVVDPGGTGLMRGWHGLKRFPSWSIYDVLRANRMLR